MPKKPRKLLKSAGGPPPKVAGGPTGFPARKGRDEAKARGREPSIRTVELAAQAAFLAAFQDCGSIRRAALAACVSRSQVYAWMDENPEFKNAVDASRQQICGLIDDELFRRAIHGTARLKFHEGKVIKVSVKQADGTTVDEPYVEFEYSDRCLELLAKANNPAKYREKIDHRLDGEVVLKVFEVEVPAE